MTVNTKASEKVYKQALTLVRVFRQVHNEMPMQMADVFLTIARRPGLTMSELAEDTDLSQSAVSRNVATLSKYQRLGKEGLNLVETINDPVDNRRRLLFLTKTGKVLATRALRALEEEFSYDKDTDARMNVLRAHELEIKRRQEEGTDDELTSRMKRSTVALPR